MGLRPNTLRQTQYAKLYVLRIVFGRFCIGAKPLIRELYTKLALERLFDEKKRKKMDNLANLFSAIQNGQQRQKKFIRVPFSKKSWHLCNILFLEGFLQGFFAQENHLYIFLKYSQNKPVLRKISKISLQGRKIYTKAMGRKFIERPTEKANSELVALKEFPRTSLMSSGFDGPMSLESIVLAFGQTQYVNLSIRIYALVNTKMNLRDSS
jgi:ribosomal protein S8